MRNGEYSLYFTSYLEQLEERIPPARNQSLTGAVYSKLTSLVALAWAAVQRRRDDTFRMACSRLCSCHLRQYNSQFKAQSLDLSTDIAIQRPTSMRSMSDQKGGIHGISSVLQRISVFANADFAAVMLGSVFSLAGSAFCDLSSVMALKSSNCLRCPHCSPIAGKFPVVLFTEIFQSRSVQKDISPSRAVESKA